MTLTGIRAGLRVVLGVVLVTASLGSIALVHASPANAEPAKVAADLTGLHDFDFLVGDWRVHHRVKRPTGSDPWWEFDGACSNRGLVQGHVNVEEHTFNKPTGVTYGIGLRAYDPQTAQWAIWWIDGRDPHGPLDPPVKGRFVQGVGTFYSDYVDNGKPMRVRFTWSRITPTSARWEQAVSADAGATWDTNWIMEFRRAS